MVKIYTITDEKFLEAKKLITQNGGIIYPNGNFEIKGVKGCYGKEGETLTVVIKDKPWLANWKMIGEKLDEFFG